MNCKIDYIREALKDEASILAMENKHREILNEVIKQNIFEDRNNKLYFYAEKAMQQYAFMEYINNREGQILFDRMGILEINVLNAVKLTPLNTDKIEIKEKILQDIYRYVDVNMFYNKQAAAKIVKVVNKLWPNAVRSTNYKSSDVDKIIINNLSELVEIEFDKQKNIKRDIDYYNGDEALYEQEENYKEFYTEVPKTIC